MRILSVDDDDDNLFLVARVARSRNHEVVCTHNGIEALDALETRSFDLIVSDILMPGMDGFRLCQAVKADSRFRSIPFIFYSATYTAKEDQELAAALGASRFVVKPAGRDEFLAIIEEVVKEGAAETLPVPDLSPDDGGKTMALYNERLVRKLERKIEQLEGARAELFRSEEQLRLMWDSSMDGMVLCDEEGLILRANRAFSRMIGKPVESLPGLPVPRCRSETGENVLAPGRDVIRSGAFAARCEGVLDSPDGAAIHVEVSRAVVGMPEPLALFSVVRDVTERLRLEREHMALQSQLYQSQKLEVVGRLAGSVAHDFNNLLTVINGYSSLLSEAIPEKDPSRNAVDQIRQAGQRAADLALRLLGFTRRQPVRYRALELNRVVEKATQLLTRLLGPGITLSIRFLAQPVVYADPLQLEQVLMNLVVNARDAMPEGGSVRIETDALESTQSQQAPSESSSGVWAVLTVQDDGVGIAEEALAHIFEPFYTSKSPEKGTGLGLSIVESIVRQAGGRIEAKSSPGRGATFRVYLPAMQATSAGPEPQPVKIALADRERGDYTVMLVDDQASVRGYVERALLAHGYRVVTAGGVEDAMRLLRSAQARPDIVLTDVTMPDGNGIALARRIQDHWSGIPVLLMSGYAENAPEMGDHVKDDVKAPAPYELIQKPFSPDQVVAKIRELLGRGDRGASAGVS